MSEQGVASLMFDRQLFTKTVSLHYRENHPLNVGATVLFFAVLLALSEEEPALPPWAAEATDCGKQAWVRESF